MIRRQSESLSGHLDHGTRGIVEALGLKKGLEAAESCGRVAGRDGRERGGWVE